MIQELPDIPKDARYGVSEVAELLGVSRATIFRWVKNGDLFCRYNTVNHRRVFTHVEINKFWKNTLTRF